LTHVANVKLQNMEEVCRTCAPYSTTVPRFHPNYLICFCTFLMCHVLSGMATVQSKHQ